MASAPEEIERRFNESALAITHAMIDLSKHITLLEDNDLLGHLESYKVVYEAYERIERTQKILGEIKRKLSYETLPDIMRTQKIPSIRFSDRLFSVGTRIDASIPQHMQEKGFQWLRDNGLGDIIKPTTNAKTLSSVLTQFIEETAISPPDDCVKIHTQEYISMRK